MWALVSGAALGAVFAALITIWVEYLRSPKLALSREEPTRVHQDPPGSPASWRRPVRVLLANKTLRGPRWMTRAPALQCRATITFHHLDGQNIFGRPMEGRWAGSPEPAAIDAVGEILHPGEAADVPHDQIRMKIIDLLRISLRSRIDVYPGESETLDVAVRLDDDEQCYGWNNETYLCQTPWRNPQWRLECGRYLVRVTVVSSGQKCIGTFRLINDVEPADFRLEDARPEDLLKF
jgi:hypothetical protein